MEMLIAVESDATPWARAGTVHSAFPGVFHVEHQPHITQPRRTFCRQTLTFSLRAEDSEECVIWFFARRRRIWRFDGSRQPIWKC
jgi:hypothetical protein